MDRHVLLWGFKMIKVVIFDFDGVLVESVDIKTAAFAELFRKEGESVLKKIVDYHIANTGVSRYEKFRYIYRKILEKDLSEKEFNVLCDRFASLVVKSVVKAPYVKGAYQFLSRNREKYRFFVTSATPQNEVEAIIKERGIEGFFSAIYGAPTKKRDAVKQVLIEEGVDASNAIYVGDALSDYEAARESNINFIARIYKNENLFFKIDCPKIRDLEFLEKTINLLNENRSS